MEKKSYKHIRNSYTPSAVELSSNPSTQWAQTGGAFSVQSQPVLHNENISKKKKKKKKKSRVKWRTPLIPALGRGRWISEFESSLVYRVSSRTAMATQRNQKKKKS